MIDTPDIIDEMMADAIVYAHILLNKERYKKEKMEQPIIVAKSSKGQILLASEFEPITLDQIEGYIQDCQESLASWQKAKEAYLELSQTAEVVEAAPISEVVATEVTQVPSGLVEPLAEPTPVAESAAPIVPQEAPSVVVNIPVTDAEQINPDNLIQ